MQSAFPYEALFDRDFWLQLHATVSEELENMAFLGSHLISLGERKMISMNNATKVTSSERTISTRNPAATVAGSEEAEDQRSHART
jgi:hypothetical protein